MIPHDLFNLQDRSALQVFGLMLKCLIPIGIRGQDDFDAPRIMLIVRVNRKSLLGRDIASLAVSFGASRHIPNQVPLNAVLGVCHARNHKLWPHPTGSAWRRRIAGSSY